MKKYSKKKKKSKPFAVGGKNNSGKVNYIKKYLHNSNADYYLITACDSIAWIFNIRAKDITISTKNASNKLMFGRVSPKISVSEKIQRNKSAAEVAPINCIEI